MEERPFFHGTLSSRTLTLSWRLVPLEMMFAPVASRNALMTSASGVSSNDIETTASLPAAGASATRTMGCGACSCGAAGFSAGASFASAAGLPGAGALTSASGSAAAWARAFRGAAARQRAVAMRQTIGRAFIMCSWVGFVSVRGGYGFSLRSLGWGATRAAARGVRERPFSVIASIRHWKRMSSVTKVSVSPAL